MRGMTWDHPRGYEPLIAASALWETRTGVSIRWDRRSLQDFETYPVEALARDYDLIVIDHPHVGLVAQADVLHPYDGNLGNVADGSVGGSFDSYRWQGRQWALPIDAAAQVLAWVPGRLAAPIGDWADITDRAAHGQIALPLKPPHSLMSLMTLCGLAGIRLDATAPMFFPAEAASALEQLAALSRQCGPDGFDQDPIDVLEAMARPDSRLCCAPLIYGYVSYALKGFRPARIAFADLVPMGAGKPIGSVLGGTGIAVSVFSGDKDGAAAFARWLASGAVQRAIVAMHGGQPAHADAWVDAAVNASVLDFYRATRRTLDGAWVRPRHAGYMTFQHMASLRINDALRQREAAAALLDDLNALFLWSHPSEDLVE